MTRMRMGWIVGLVAALVAATTVAAAQGAPATVTPAQLKSGFKKATGEKLVVDRGRTSAGSYTAFSLGVQTKTRQDRYGTFTIYLVTGSDVAADVNACSRTRTPASSARPPPAGSTGSRTPR